MGLRPTFDAVIKTIRAITPITPMLSDRAVGAFLYACGTSKAPGHQTIELGGQDWPQSSVNLIWELTGQ